MSESVSKLSSNKISELQYILDLIHTYAAQEETLVRDLPEQLQTLLRQHKEIGPLTSSGLEHVYQIFNRIDFIIMEQLYGNDENKNSAEAEKNQQKSQHQVLQVSTDTRIPVTIKRFPDSNPEHPEKPRQENNQTLDFGPFDPRKG